MDTQMKRGLLDVCVLAAIKSEDMQPYVSMSESTLYPILRRLETAGFLTVRSLEHNGRLRKYYHITPAGLDRIAEFRDEWREIQAIYQFVTREEDHG